MKSICLLFAALAVCSAFTTFHSSYISKFKKVTRDMPKAVTCEPYMCAPEPLQANQCVYPNDGVNFLQICPQGSFCPWGLSSPHNATCIPGSTALSYGGNPGDACKTNGDCGGLSFCNTTTMVCQGRTINQPCNDQPDCDVGYVCHNVERAATCQPMKTLGTSCGNYLDMNLCINTLTCNYGKCINLFSLSDGSFVQYDVASLACKSGFFERTNRDGQAVCRAAPQSPNVNLPIKCTAGSYCYSRDRKYAANCECGFNSNGQGYCPLFPGDLEYQSFLYSLKNYMTDPGLNQCHYLDVGQPSCPGIAQTVYENLASQMLEIQFYVAKLGNDRCVKNVITSEYWYGQ